MGTLRRIAPALGLFLLSPLVAEFMLGNIPIDQFGFFVLLAPMYGGGALLIREAARRTGRGWPTMVLLAMAYGLLEEGPVDQLLWNPHYSGLHLLNGDSFVPVLGTSIKVVQDMMSLHTVWSICVPIALLETFVPRRRTTPWLRVPGLVVTAVVFTAGAAFVWSGTRSEEHFMATPVQLGTAGVVIVALVVAAFTVVRPRTPATAAPAPHPLLVGVLAFVLTGLYAGPYVLAPDDWSEWPQVAAWFVLVAIAVLAVTRWSGRAGWGAPHRLALAAGALFTYSWTASPERPTDASSTVVDLVGNAVFAAAVLALVGAAIVVLRRDVRVPAGSDPARTP